MYPDYYDDLIVASRVMFDGLTEKTQVAYCLHRLEAEVNNGGFYQFLANPSGENALETLSSLEKIQAMKTAGLLRNAIKLAYKDGFPEDPLLHGESIVDTEQLHDQLYEIDKKFYQYEDDLPSLVNAFLQNVAYE